MPEHGHAPETVGSIMQRMQALAETAPEPPTYAQPPLKIVRAVAPRVPRAYPDATLGNWDVNRGGAEHKRGRQDALRAVQGWCKSASERGRGMLALIGPPGTGKSFLLYAAVRELYDIRDDFKIFARPWYRLADDLRYGGPAPWSDHKLESPELRAKLYGADAVAIDEVRPTAGTAFDDTELAKLACHAWDECLPLIITSNVSPLSDVLGGPAADRFVAVTLMGPSLR